MRSGSYLVPQVSVMLDEGRIRQDRVLALLAVLSRQWSASDCGKLTRTCASCTSCPCGIGPRNIDGRKRPRTWSRRVSHPDAGRSLPPAKRVGQLHRTRGPSKRKTRRAHLSKFFGASRALPRVFWTQDAAKYTRQFAVAFLQERLSESRRRWTRERRDSR